MKPLDASKALNIGASTLRNWTANDFRMFFSEGAQGGSGRARNLNEQDLRVLAFIDQQKKQSVSTDEIYEALRQMQANDWRNLPDLNDMPQGVASFPVVPAAAAEAALSAERKALMREIGFLQERVEELEDKLADERENSDRQLRELSELNGKLQRALTLVELYEDGRLKPKE